MLIDKIIQLCSKYEKTMKSLSFIPAAEHAIYPSEMLPLCALAMKEKPSCVIESGRQYGFSTNVLAEWFRGSKTKIISMDVHPPTSEAEDRLKSFLKVRLFTGDSRPLIPLFASAEKSIVLIDGPKEQSALDLVEELRGKVRWVFVHDMVNWDFSKANPNNVFVTSDKRYRARFSYLDCSFLTSLGYEADSPGGGMAVFKLF